MPAMNVAVIISVLRLKPKLISEANTKSVAPINSEQLSANIFCIILILQGAGIGLE